MSLTIEIAADADATTWDDITGYIAWDQGMRCGGQAAYGDVGTASGWNLDDDGASAVIPTKRVVRMIENATTPDTVLFKGRVSDKTLSRGTKFEGDATKFDTTLDDNNSQLQGIPVDGWSRPQETGRARIRALMAEYCAGSPRASTDLDYTTYVPNTNTVVMPPKKYTNTNVAEVAKDCADTEGKQVFVTSDDELFYDLDTSTAYAASLAITDDSPNLTSQFPPIDASGEYQGNEFVSGATIKYGDKNRSVSDVNATAEAAHDYWRVILTDGGKNATQATSKLATLLANQSIEEQTFRCDIQLLKTQVDKVKYGQTLSFRSGAAGVTTPRTLRVTQLTWEPIGPDHYIAHLELGVPTKLRRKLRNAPTDPAANPLDDSPFVCTPTDFTVPLGGGGGSVMRVNFFGAYDPSGGTGDSLADYGEYVLLYPTAVYSVRTFGTSFIGPQPLTPMRSNLINSSVFSADLGSTDCGFVPAHTAYCPPLSTRTDPHTAMGTLGVPTTYYATMGFLPWSGHSPVGSSWSVEITYVSGPDPRFEDLGPCSESPRLGQKVIESFTSDGSTLLQGTNFPYSEGSLDVKAAGVHVPVTETDPLAGTFTLLEALPAGAVVEITYRASDTVPTSTANPYTDPAPYDIPYTLLGTGGDGSGGNVLHDDGTWGPEGGAPSLTNPMTDEGDLIVGDVGGVPIRLPIGAEGENLRVIGGVPVWAGGVTPGFDEQAWMPLTTVVGGVPELVWDDDDSLVPTLTPLS